MDFKASGPPAMVWPLTKTFIRVSKIVAFIMLAFCMHLSAKTSAQKITLNEKNISLQQVFVELHKQTGFQFFYNDELLDKAGKIDIEVKDATLEETLNICFKNLPYSYEIVEKAVVVKQKPFQRPGPPSGDIHGRITNDKNEPLQGVNIVVKGTKTGTTTDADGAFVLRNVDLNATIIITYIGYERQEMKLSGKTAIVVSLKQAAESLHDVVVNKGYYTEKQRLSTGNVSIVKGEDIQKQPVQDPIIALEGLVPGLSISQSSGIPGAYSTVHLRGQNFLLGGPNPAISLNDPFYLVDGIPFSSESPTNSFVGGGALGTPYPGELNPYGQNPTRSGLSPFAILNPSDIESIVVLKDADATAIYGARGANGVILITTKKGKPGPLKVDVNFSAGSSRVARKLDLMNTQQYLEMRREALKNDGVVPGLYDFDINGVWDTTRYTDWQRELVDRPASFLNTQVNVSGGTGNTHYLIGGGYSRQGTTFPGDYSNQNTSFFANINSASVNERFHINLSASYNYGLNNVPGDGGLAFTMGLSPDSPPLYDANGNINWQPKGSFRRTWTNPLVFTYSSVKSVSDYVSGNLGLSYRIIKGLEISANLGYNKTETNSQLVYLSNYFAPPNNIPLNSSISMGTGKSNGWIIEPKLSYHREIGAGNLDFLVGTTFQESSSSAIGYYFAGFTSDLFITNPASAQVKSFSGYNTSDYRYNSIYSRLGYNLKEKYLINLTARRDGSSRFGSGEQFGNFGSAGIGWIFSKEGFIQNALPWLSFGKLRASYGSVGSDAIGDYQFVRTYSIGTTQTYQNLVTVNPNGHANPYYQWETDKKLEFGMELGFLRDRINLSISYYRNRTSNQLTSYPLPDFTGSRSVVENLPATIENTGWEFTANSVNVKTRDFRWTTVFNISFPQNKLVSFPGIENTSYRNTYSIGRSMSSALVYHYLGVDPQTGVYTYGTKTGTGLPNYPVDLANQVWSKPITQQLFGGFDNTFTYKGFSIDIRFQFVSQNEIYVPGMQLPGQWSPGGYLGNQPVSLLSRWQKPGDKTNIQLFTSGNNGAANSAFQYYRLSDAAIVDGSFIRLKNLAISYSLPDSWQKKAHLQGLRVYVQCQNLLTITSYPGWDPETGGYNVPPYKTVTAGIQITL